jgi:chromosome segregation ATPase
MTSTAKMRGPDPQDEARNIIADADRLIRQEEAKLDVLRQKRAELNEQFRVKDRERAEAQEKSRRLEVERQCNELVAADADVLTAVEDAEGQLKAYVTAIDRAYTAEARRRKAANMMAGDLRLSMTVELGQQGFTARLVGGQSARTAEIGACRMNRWGALALPNWSLYPTSVSWREREEKATAESVRLMLDHARGH